MQARNLAALMSAIAILAFATAASAQQSVTSGESGRRTSVQGPYQIQATSPSARQPGQSVPAPSDPEQPVCGHCSADVQAQPVEAGADFHIRLPGVDGETSPPPPQSAPTPRAEHSVTAGGQAVVPEQPICGHCAAGVAPPTMASAALIVPAVQRVSDAETAPAPDGARLVPELPICAHCAADVASPPAAAEPARAERPRRRTGFSLTIGGVTVGSGGVNVAVGDIDGDSSSGARREPSTAEPTGSTRPR